MKTLMKRALRLLLAGALVWAGQAQAQLRYDEEYPAMGYTTRALTDPVTALGERLEAGEISLEAAGHRGYLDSLLAALDIDPSSQLLVFSKTSLKNRFITGENPRAIYFNDEVYVAWIPGTTGLELASMDPVLGPQFFGLSQTAEPDFDRELNRCLRCHDSYSLTGGGVPRFIMTSVLAGPDGNVVSHEISEVTTTATPLSRRWGGWYVTGSHGDQAHLGNLLITDAAMIRERDMSRTGNRQSLEEFADLSGYLSPHSDIVALLVIEHQVEVQNQLTRTQYLVSTALDQGSLTDELLAEYTEPLLRSLLMADEVALQAPVSGTAGYSDYFQQLGPFDSQGRSLRQLDLQTRTFTYPLSYLIYSPAFAALPEPALDYVKTRLTEILGGQDESGDFAHLTPTLSEDILAILEETFPALLP